MYDELVNELRDGDAFEICGAYDILGRAADALEELADRNVGKWIPVTERLPEKEDEAVIVWEKQGFALIDWRHDNKWAILDNNYGIATHWMPLPEPPKEE